MRILRTGGVAAASAIALSLSLAAPAQAQPVQDGLVNVNVGDVTILQDVNIALAAQVAAQICGVKVGPIAVIGRAVDRSGATEVACQSEQGPITFSQN